MWERERKVVPLPFGQWGIFSFLFVALPCPTLCKESGAHSQVGKLKGSILQVWTAQMGKSIQKHRERRENIWKKKTTTIKGFLASQTYISGLFEDISTFTCKTRPKHKFNSGLTINIKEKSRRCELYVDRAQTLWPAVFSISWLSWEEDVEDFRY